MPLLGASTLLPSLTTQTVQRTKILHLQTNPSKPGMTKRKFKLSCIPLTRKMKSCQSCRRHQRKLLQTRRMGLLQLKLLVATLPTEEARQTLKCKTYSEIYSGEMDPLRKERRLHQKKMPRKRNVPYCSSLPF